MRRKLIIIISSVVLILVTAVLGFSIVLSVNDVCVQYTLYSEDAKARTAVLQEKLDAYLGKNFIFQNLDDFYAVYADDPYLNVLSVEKKFPDRIEIQVEERMETYAVARQEEGATVYYILDRDGNVLTRKAQNVNNLDGGANVVLEGVSFTKLTVGEKAEGDSWADVLAVCRGVDQALSGLRSSVKRIVFSSPTSDAADDSVLFEMAEGVTLSIFNPAHLTELKVEKSVGMYLGLSDLDKMFGKIETMDHATDASAVICTYTSRDNVVTVG